MQNRIISLIIFLIVVWLVLSPQGMQLLSDLFKGKKEQEYQGDASAPIPGSKDPFDNHDPLKRHPNQGGGVYA
jgi:hypothetical protein